MTYKILRTFSTLFLFLPLFLITGPAIPDIIITLGVIYGLYYFLFKDYRLYFNHKILFNSLIAFWITLIFISFFSVYKVQSFIDSIIFIRFLLIPVCIYLLFFKKDNQLFILTFIVFVLVFLVCIDTLYQFFNYSSKYGFGNDLLGFKSTWYGRLTGPFGDELITGSYVSKFGLIGLIFLMMYEKIKFKTIIQSVYLALILVVCFASGERMSLATFSLGLVILLLFLDNYRYTILLSIVIGLISIFIIYKFHPFYNDFEIIESTQYHKGLTLEKSFICEEDASKICKKIIKVQPSFFEVIRNFKTSAYGEIYSVSFKIFKDFPITGIGLSNFEELCKNSLKYKEKMINYNCASHPHNIYIQWITEGGIIVFISFIFYLYSLVLHIIRDKGDKKFKIVSLAIFIIMFWPIMSTGSLIKNWYGVTTFFIIGICLCLGALKQKT